MNYQAYLLFHNNVPLLKNWRYGVAQSYHGLVSKVAELRRRRSALVYNCERLGSWVSSLQFPLSLDLLAISSIPNLEIVPSLDNLSSLRFLSIVNWRNLKYLPTGLQWPTGLEALSIGGFWEDLDSFPDFQVGSLMHLTRLYLYGWPKLKSLPQQIQRLTSLTSLWIYYFEGVETLPEWLGSLTSLTHLVFWGCKNLKNLSVQKSEEFKCPSYATPHQITKSIYCGLSPSRGKMQEGQRHRLAQDFSHSRYLNTLRQYLD